MSISEEVADLAGSTSTVGWANVSGAVYGRIDPYFDSDWFLTYLVSGVTYRFQMLGVGLDSYLTLRNNAGGQITFANATGIDGFESITYTPVVTGYYFLDAQSFRASTGNTGFYNISITSVFKDDFSADIFTSSALSLGTSAGGSLELAGDADWHRVNLVGGQTYSLRLGGALANGYLKVFDQFGLAAGPGSVGSGTFTPSTSGVYFVEVSGSSFTDVGSYALTVAPIPRVSAQGGFIQEGNAGTKSLPVVVSLSAPSALSVSVVIDTPGETALAGKDYQAVHQTVTIPPGFTSVTVNVPIIGNTVFEPTRTFEINLSNPVNASLGGNGYGFIVDDDTPAGMTLPSDDLYGFQWYLYVVRAGFAWSLATGAGVKVGVFDQGIDSTNPDLASNTSTSLGRSALSLAAGGSPTLSTDNHGTWVAGVIGAARDGQGTVGIAYNAQLVSIYTPATFSADYLTEIKNAFGYAKSLDVLNNSWGFGNLLASGTNWAFLDNANSAAFAPAFAALKDLATNGRHGLGTVVVQSAGNSFSFGDDTNLHNFQNSRYIITVGSTDYFGHVSPFSTNGASILVSAPGGGGDGNSDSILTTDRLGSAGASSGNFDYVDGTSFSAPVVSGVVALMLQANPSLGYRDVQQILAYTAQKVDIGVGVWKTNGAQNWNGGGLHFDALDHATGFGQVDALAAVRLAASWDATPQTVSNTKEIIATKVVNQAIPDNNPTGVFSAIQITDQMRIERVDVSINITHTFVGDLEILLSSPSGTTSFLLWRPSKGALSAFGSSQDNIHFTFDTVLDWGENSAGVWGLGVYDAAAGSFGTLDSWTIDIVGKAEGKDRVFIYTNEYPSIVAAEPGRALLSDPGGGHDTINAGALGLDNRIDLSGATLSVLNGANLAIAPGTTVDKAVGGDGNDSLVASPRGSVLRGMGGNDTIIGGIGPDTLDGGGGIDSLIGGPNIDTAVFHGVRSAFSVSPVGSGFGVQASTIDSDVLTGIERLAFDDTFVALDLDGHAGVVAKVIGAIFGAQYLTNRSFVGIGLSLVDSGMSEQELVGLAAGTDFFAQVAGSHSNTDFVKLVYKNVVGIAPSASELTYYVGLLNDGTFTQASLGLLACELDLTKVRIDLVGLGHSGIEYVPYVVG